MKWFNSLLEQKRRDSDRSVLVTLGARFVAAQCLKSTTPQRQPLSQWPIRTLHIVSKSPDAGPTCRQDGLKEPTTLYHTIAICHSNPLLLQSLFDGSCCYLAITQTDRGTFQENLVELTLQIQSTDLHRPMSSGIGGAQFRRIYINAGAAGMMPWMLHKLSKSQLIISRFVVAAQKTVFFFHDKCVPSAVDIRA